MRKDERSEVAENVEPVETRTGHLGGQICPPCKAADSGEVGSLKPTPGTDFLRRAFGEGAALDEIKAFLVFDSGFDVADTVNSNPVSIPSCQLQFKTVDTGKRRKRNVSRTPLSRVQRVCLVLQTTDCYTAAL